MVEVPVSARWLSGIGAAVFLLPLGIVVLGFSWSGLELYAVGLLLGGACAVPPFLSDPARHRRACAVAGIVITVVSAPFVFLGVVFLASIWYGAVFLACFSLPAAAVAGLTAGFQRARGREHGRLAAGIAWASGATALVGWVTLTAFVTTLPTG
ncbi:hypothetical protein ACWD4P_20575 [Kitasatospora sp. NPDC002543]